MRTTRTWKVDIIPKMSTHLPRSCKGPRYGRNSSARSSRHHHRISVLWGKHCFTLDDCTNLIPRLTCSHILVLNALLEFFFFFFSSSNSHTVDYEDSCLIVRYLASMRPFAQSFDIYLSQVRDFLLNTIKWKTIQCRLSLPLSSHFFFCTDFESAWWECHCSQN